MKLYKKDILDLIEKFTGLDSTKIAKLENELLNKRINWLNNNAITATLEGDDLEKAYCLLCLKIGIDKREAPIIEKTNKKLVFHSRNYCPTLEACKFLGLDTREVCRNIYEKPTDILVKKVNLKLRFSRNYDKLRPYCDYCEEMIILEE